ncbi:endonuclease/exonuclease/phosphatase family protein [Amnibacterium kyonggiense]|uniref:Endonuclease/exonuclease/phosphatase family protein n=1 Tax=Amnibacterium kyonggiense TaxID=595671 RepID=A0A4R7FJ65_9MICO|nr:endonuclease/exonuclease/phosphatase family protein [Amnibacterium kyonggiense]TDS76062.1 endonuclease/exonuclease/phosphatase family protein [Amnibacterium kyonggiense]
MRHRRSLSAVLVTALAAVGIAGSLSTAHAATPSAPIALSVVGGDAQISAAWTAVPGATGYAVRWGTGTRLDRTLTTRSTSVRLPRAVNGRTYSVRVSARGVSATSPRRTARAAQWMPTRITSVRAVPAGPDRIAVSWTGGGQARSVKVLAGADTTTDIHHFSTPWMPAAVHSAVLTVPRSLRGVIGAGTGNVVFVKVAQTNSRRADLPDGYRYSAADKYTLTPSGTWSLAGMAADTAPTTSLSVATWNVQSVTASAGYAPQNRWDQRLPKVVANIEAHAPALLGVQELTTARIVPDCLNPSGKLQCVEQYQTLQRALAQAPVPYAIARPDANAWVYAHANSYVDSELFYDPAKLAVDEAGFISPRDLTGSAWPSSMGNEAGSWARFHFVDPSGGQGRSFFAVSIHLPVGDDNGRVRKAEATAIARFMDAKARQRDGTALPIVFVGDFNSYGALQDDAGDLQLLADGYIDSAATADRTNLDLSTDNFSNGRGGVDADYPVDVVRHPYPTSRIDYIMLKNSPHPGSYRNLAPIVDGRFDQRYQGSDHNMQLAVVGIGDPIPAAAG